MQHLMKNFMHWCSRYVCWLAFFAALITLVMLAGETVDADRCGAIYTAEQNSVLSAVPCEENDEAAFRWDSFQHFGRASRVDNRTGFRQQNTLVTQTDEKWITENNVEILIHNCLLQYHEVRHCFYHKIWCRVLPTRAGPVHG